jgi:plastocyanin
MRSKKPARRKMARKKATRRKKAARRTAPKRKRSAARRSVGAKKRAAKKKVAKKTAKKAAKSTKAKGRHAKLVTVVLDPRKPLGSKKSHLKRLDQIRWRNRDTVDHTIHFTSPDWPFDGQRRDVLVLAGHPSETLKVTSGANTGPHDYTVVPPVVYTPGTPPDGPTVIVDG